LIDNKIIGFYTMNIKWQ